MYRWVHFWPNAPRYAGWMLQTQGPAVALAALAPAVFFRAEGNEAGDIARTRHVVAISALVVVTVWLCYAFYLPFGAWWTLRFLLPAFPAFFVVVSAALFPDRGVAARRRTEAWRSAQSWRSRSGGASGLRGRLARSSPATNGGSPPSAVTWTSMPRVNRSCSRGSTAAARGCTPIA